MKSQTPSTYKGDILMVDDTPDNLRVLSSMLQSHGYQVRKTINGKLAINAALIAPPDLILLDINMPTMNGYQVCKQLKSVEKTRHIPVIFISALNGPIDKVRAFEAGGVDYITKPFHVEEVLARVETQLNLHKLQKQLQVKNKQLELEITDRQRAEDEIRFLLSTTQAISICPDFHSALQVTLRQVCELIDWDFGEAWIPNEDDTGLECSKGWYASDPKLSEFRQEIQSMTFSPDVGMVGRIWSSKQFEWIEDVSSEYPSVFCMCEFALKVGLKSAFGIPIIVDNNVLCVLLFFNKKRIEPNLRLVELVSAVATQLGGLIQRKKAEAALKQANLKLERLATFLQHANLALKHLANVDSLTQVANRRHFDEYLNQEWCRLMSQKSPLSLILCDVDYFKAYNDTYGHQAGDDCLQQIAKAIGSALGNSADLVARYGGEEFAVILPSTSAEEAGAIAASIRLEVQKLKIPHDRSKVSKYVTLSLGVASLIPQQGVPPATLINRADRGLYKAKNLGRNRIFLY